MFTYCTQVLHLSEHATYGRIEAARTARKFPIVLDRLHPYGSLTLTAITLLGPLLTATNHCEVLEEARHKTRRQVEEIVARLRPQPEAAATVRKLPEPKPVRQPSIPVVARAIHSESAPGPMPPAQRPATVTPLAPERYKVQLTVSRETHDKLRRVQDLLRHSIPNGDPAAIFDRALSRLLSDLERVKLAAAVAPKSARQPASGSRYVPATVRRDVWKRDDGRCAFAGAHGRCTERGFLEFHHRVPPRRRRHDRRR